MKAQVKVEMTNHQWLIVKTLFSSTELSRSGTEKMGVMGLSEY